MPTILFEPFPEESKRSKHALAARSLSPSQLASETVREKFATDVERLYPYSEDEEISERIGDVFDELAATSRPMGNFSSSTKRLRK